MAQLITMRQRIKAVETIKKITHAMRLISMSAHSRLRHKKTFLEQYKNAFQSLWSRVSHVVSKKDLEKQAHMRPQHLIILVAAQKGLCGTFNSSLFKFFDQEVPKQEPSQQIIAVGKYATDHLKQQNKIVFAAYNDFSASNFVAIAQAITALIVESPQPYDSVTVYSNYQKNFFVQRPRKNIVYPLPEPETTTPKDETPTEYLFEQSPEELSITIRNLLLTVSLQEILFDSLLAEQAARFISMDSSTRNADKLLVSMKLEYNKTRQTTITRELTELASSY